MYLNLINKIKLLKGNIGIYLPGFRVVKDTIKTLKQALIIKEIGQFD